MVRHPATNPRKKLLSDGSGIAYTGWLLAYKMFGGWLTNEVEGGEASSAAIVILSAGQTGCKCTKDK